MIRFVKTVLIQHFNENAPVGRDSRRIGSGRLGDPGTSRWRKDRRA
jgi:hypothetical protein